jgi:sigma-B regulation protein RsbU (phosphoserine phosphatase)
MKKQRRQSLNRRITTILLALMLAMAVILSIVSYMAIRSVYLRFYNEKAQQLVHIVSQRTNWEKLEPFVETGEADEYALDLMEFYNSVKENFLTEGYLYLFVPGEHSFTYLIEARTEDEDPDALAKWGDTFEYTEFEYKYLVPDIEAGRAHEEIIYMGENEYGGGLETWAPVFDSAGNVRAMVEVDIRMPSFRQDLNGFVIRIIGVFILLVAAVLFLTLQYLNRSVTRPIVSLERSVNAYEHGKLELDASHYKKDDEIKGLAESFDEMTRRIAAYNEEVTRASAERERIGAEMDVARKMQTDSLPSVFPAFPERSDFDVFAGMIPAREIGGDFYDFFMVDDDHLALTVGDIAGKGIPVALFMVMVKTLIKNRVLQGLGPAEVMQSVSEQMLESDQADIFSTVWLAVIELSTGKGIAANAGHEHPVLRRAGGKFELQAYKHSPPLAAMEGVRFHDHGFQLEPGDTLFIYTDGLTDAVNAKNEIFGPGRIVDALNEEPEASPAMLIQMTKEAVFDYTGRDTQSDDMTMLVFKYFGPGGTQEV